MPKIIEGSMIGQGLKVALVISRFNSFITEELLKGASDALMRHGVAGSDILVIRVPGAFELPQVARRVAQSQKFDAVVVLGALIRGGTSHFEYIAAEVSKGVAQLAMESSCVVSFGVLTCDSLEQAIERAGTKAGNKGADAALAAIETANVVRELGEVQ